MSLLLKMRLLMVDNMLRFSTQDMNINHKNMIRSSFFKHKAIHTPILFSSLNMVHEVPLRQKEAYAPPQASKRAKHLQSQRIFDPKQREYDPQAQTEHDISI